MVGRHSMDEYRRQAQAWERALSLDARLPETHGNIVFFGGGVALSVAKTLAFTTQTVLGRPAMAVASQDLAAYPGIVAGLGAELFVSISRTGAVSDNIAAIKSIRKAQQSATIFGLVGEDPMDYGTLCDDLLVLGIHEESVATTQTISAMALAGQVLIAKAGTEAGAARFFQELSKLPDLLRSLTPRYDELGRILAADEFDQIVFLGSGPSLGIAEAGALAVLEMSVEKCLSHQPGVFMHGHFVTTRLYPTLVVLYLSDGGRAAELDVLRQLSPGKVTASCIGNGVGEAVAAHKIEMNADISDAARALLYLPFAQTLGIKRSVARGYDPDMPPGLPKVF